MTVFYPDVYNGDSGFTVASGTVLVVAKATEGVYYTDASFQRFKAEAAAVGAAFSGYHFLKQESSPEAQAAYYFNVAGKTPCMIDAEEEGGSRPGVDWCIRFKTALEGLGGRVWSVYYPRWYWGLTGGNLASLGVPVIASEYRSYEDYNWPAPYGGITPKIWQYTSSPYDRNAFQGSAEELVTLVYGDNMTPDEVWSFKNANLDKIDMRQYLVNVADAMPQVLAQLAALSTKVDSIVGGSVNATAVADAELAEIKAKL